MAEKNIKARIIHKHDIEANWITAGNNGFTPQCGELIVYDPDETHLWSRTKIGDGVTDINNLPFDNNIRSLIDGEADGSLEQFNSESENHAIGEHSIALGTATIAGAKGFLVSNIEKVTNDGLSYYNGGTSIKLTLDSVTGLEINDVISLRYYADAGYLQYSGNIATITAIAGNIVTATIAEGKKTSHLFQKVDSPTDKQKSYLWVVMKPNIGSHSWFSAQHAEGHTTIAIGTGAHAEGSDTIANGQYAHAEGNETYAEYSCHAEGKLTKAFGEQSHAEGYMTEARSGHAEGVQTKSLSRATHAEGELTVAEGQTAHAEGRSSKAIGNYSHAEGYNTTASGEGSHSEGITSTASGKGSHTEGSLTVASAQDTHAEGQSTTASALAAHAEGKGTKAQEEAAHAEGISSVASGKYSHAEGFVTTASGEGAHSEGGYYYDSSTAVTTRTLASGKFAHAEGNGAQAVGEGAHAEGRGVANGFSSHAEGIATANENYSHAEGNGTTSASYAHAEGQGTKAQGAATHAEGINTTASGRGSHAEGQNCIADSGAGWDQTAAHAEGVATQALAKASHTEGIYTKVTKESGHAGGYYSEANGVNSFVHGEYVKTATKNGAFFGKYNADEGIFGVGNGTAEGARKNAFTVYNDGNAVASTSVGVPEMKLGKEGLYSEPVTGTKIYHFKSDGTDAFIGAQTLSMNSGSYFTGGTIMATDSMWVYTNGMTEPQAVATQAYVDNKIAENSGGSSSTGVTAIQYRITIEDYSWESMGQMGPDATNDIGWRIPLSSIGITTAHMVGYTWTSSFEGYSCHSGAGADPVYTANLSMKFALTYDGYLLTIGASTTEYGRYLTITVFYQ